MSHDVRYEIILYWSEEDQAIIAEVPELPGCVGDGATYQEALANVAKHAPGALVKIQLDIDRRVRLRVHNTAGRPGAPVIRSEGGSGLGLVGMRERAELLGGSVVAGPDGGGWVVDCSLPLAKSQAANERTEEAQLT